MSSAGDGYTVEVDSELELSDGTMLRADVYRPLGDAPHPVLLMRTPYGKVSAQQDVYPHPGYFARRGLIAVVQDVRGRFASEGEFHPFRNEREDGAETVRWCSRLEGGRGQVFAYGYSYAGLTALMAAAEQPAGLAGIIPAMTSAHAGEGWMLRAGVMKSGFAHGWATQLAQHEATRRGDDAAAARIAQARAQGPRHWHQGGLFNTDIEQFGPYFREWVEHIDDPGYWEELTGSVIPRVRVPVLLIGGWYDEFLPGTIATYHGLSAEGRTPVSLRVGPWSHSPWSRYTGSLDFGPDADPAIGSVMTEWIRKVTNGQPDAGVRYFSMGDHAWQESEVWPPAAAGRWELELSSDGLADVPGEDGRLGEPVTDEADHLWVDPAQPVRSPRGTDDPLARTYWGPIDHSRMGNRRDVLGYTTRPLSSPLLVAGPAELRLRVTAGSPLAELHAVLLDVHPDGRSYPITRGLARFERAQAGDAQPQEVPIRLDDTCARLPAGHRLRLLLSGTSMPAHLPSPRNAVPLAAADAADFGPATHLIHHDPSRPSVLSLHASGDVVEERAPQ